MHSRREDDDRIPARGACVRLELDEVTRGISVVARIRGRYDGDAGHRSRLVELWKLLRQRVAVRRVELGKAAEIRKCVDARRVRVAPPELQGIVADLRDRAELGVARVDEADSAG